MDVLIDLCLVNVNLQNLRLCRKLLRASRDAIGKARADHHEQIAVRNRVVRSLGAVHADHARVEPVVLVEGSLSHQGAADRRIKLMGKALQCGRGLR